MATKDNIKALRMFHKMSQEEFARIAGVTDKAVSAWEQGIREPRMTYIKKIADHFGLSIADIVDNNGFAVNSKINWNSVTVLPTTTVRKNLFQNIQKKQNADEQYIALMSILLKYKEYPDLMGAADKILNLLPKMKEDTLTRFLANLSDLENNTLNLKEDGVSEQGQAGYNGATKN